jgi:hypothetical protein
LAWGRSGVLYTALQAIENQLLDFESGRSAQENQKRQAAGRQLELLDKDS